MAISTPNVNNYFIGKGVVSWSAVLGGSPTWVDLGNAPSFTLQPQVKVIDHFSSRQGVKTRDDIQASEQRLTAKVKLDEWVPYNLELFFMGTGATVSGTTTIQIMANTQVKGQMQLVGTNDVGIKYTVTLPVCQITPSSQIEFIGDNFAEMELTVDVLAQIISGNITFGTIVNTSTY